MPKLEVERSIDIDAPPEKVFAVIADLGQWRSWNPWLVTDPDTKVVVRDDGKHYRWEGKRTGEGEMTIVEEDAPKFVRLDLVFLKPFKSKARVGLRVEPRGGQSRVYWTMDGGLPFFLFFLKKMMVAALTMDYDRGLTMLKDQLEKGEVPSRIEFTGPVTYPGCQYVGITTQCRIDEIGERMAADFDKLREWTQDSDVELKGEPFSLYLRWNMTKGEAEYTCGMPVATPPESPPAGFVTGTIPSLRAHVLTHVGAYRHLGNAWSTGMQMARGKEFRQSRKDMPFETYPDFFVARDDASGTVKLHFPLR